MTTYKLQIEKKALKFLARLPKKESARIMKRIEQLPDHGDTQPMRGYHEQYRLRVGDYRIIYTIDHGVLIVTVIGIGNRGDVYK